ncbi:MAG: hypothetical protein JRI31_12090 [Deltaproteobacteria bacterium]|nr:hypothetical protein [Deltaproteobacteria bacterium]
MGSDIKNFSHLVSAIKSVHENLAARAGRAVNINLTLRNWLIGAYIAEYELHGADRAAYGDRLFDEKVRTLSPQLGMPVEKLIRNLSCSHIELLVYLCDNLKQIIRLYFQGVRFEE